MFSFSLQFSPHLFRIAGRLIVNLSIPEERSMLPPAMMWKTHSPKMELYEIKAISDQDIREANKSFLDQGLPYRLVRAQNSVTDLAA